LLGRFLEVAQVTADPQAAWELYQRLGFAPAVTGDIWSHSYGVVCCAGLSLGWHAQGDEPLALCALRPNVLELHRELEAIGVEVETAQLGPDVFNQLMLREPTGMAVRALEARSFTQPADAPVRTLLGRFETLSLPSRDLDTAAAFWDRLGYEMRDADTPLGGIGIDSGLPVAYHAFRDCPEPLLVFHRDGQDLALAPLLACGLERGRNLAALAGVEHQLLRSPGEFALLQLA
jgi:hypothetical protein